MSSAASEWVELVSFNEIVRGMLEKVEFCAIEFSQLTLEKYLSGIC